MIIKISRPFHNLDILWGYIYVFIYNMCSCCFFCFIWRIFVSGTYCIGWIVILHVLPVGFTLWLQLNANSQFQKFVDFAAIKCLSLSTLKCDERKDDSSWRVTFFFTIAAVPNFILIRSLPLERFKVSTSREGWFTRIFKKFFVRKWSNSWKIQGDGFMTF